MLKTFTYLLAALFFTACNTEPKEEKQKAATLPEKGAEATVNLTEEQAYIISGLPIACIGTEYPNKTSQSLRSAEDLGTPSQLHPAFYGCFDWHSSVHGHWSIASVLNLYPNIQNKDTLLTILKNSITREKISGELTYFNRPNEYSYERTYGWAWLLKLSEALYTSKNPELKKLHPVLEPLTQVIIKRYVDYLPKLQYATRVGTHTNTAFGLSLAYDYALTLNHTELKNAIEETAVRFFKNDQQCPLSWEPGGSDFLSPCLEEANLMRKVLSQEEFRKWLEDFLPQLKDKSFTLETGIVKDRTDGHLVHLDGLNYSRAWCLYGIAGTLGKDYDHLVAIADHHISSTIVNLTGDTYEGEHWLGTFALNALMEAQKLKNPDTN